MSNSTFDKLRAQQAGIAPSEEAVHHQLATLLHMLFCEGPHLEDMLALSKPKTRGGCGFYLEHSVAECWKMPDHQQWLNNAELFQQELDANAAQAFNLLRALVKQHQQVTLARAALSEFLEQNPGLHQWSEMLERGVD